MISLSKSGSVANLWVQEPSFSNDMGTVNIENVVLNPGYIGSQGKIITINFKVKKTGTAKLSFTDGAILANDGNGTNILTGLGTATFDLEPAVVKEKEVKEKPVVVEVPLVEVPVEIIKPPVITEYPKQLNSDDPFKVSGISFYTNSHVEILLEDAHGRKSIQMTNTDANGIFTLVWTGDLSPSIYKLSARSIEKKATSVYTPELTVSIKNSMFANLKLFIITYLSIIILIIALLIFIILVIIMYLLYKMTQSNKKVHRKVKIAESSVHRAFDLLRENVRQQIKTLEKTRNKRELTKEEEKVVKKLQENLTKSEEFLEKEIAQIESKDA